jgi:homogentisate 1,2-dioxygenase
MLGNILLSTEIISLFTRIIIYQIEFETEENRLFYVESFAPFIHQNAIKRVGTAFRAPPLRARLYFANELETHDEKGDLKSKKEGMLHEIVYAHIPLT